MLGTGTSRPWAFAEVRVEDRLVNTVAEGLDAGTRLVESLDRDMVHVRLSTSCRVVVVAAPSYLERRGIPQKPADLLQHDCLPGHQPIDLSFTHGPAFPERVEGDRATTATPDELTASLGGLVKVELRDRRAAVTGVGDQRAAGGIRAVVRGWRYICGCLGPRAHVDSAICVNGRACQYHREQDSRDR